MQRLTLFLSFLLLAASLFLCQQIISKSRQNQHRKYAYSELNSVKYGLFSIDVWKEQLLAIVTDELEKIHVSKDTEQELREHVSTVLNKMIDEVAAKIAKENDKTVGGKVKQAFINMFVDVKDIKKGLPEYTDTVMRELNKPKTKRQIKSALNDQLAEFATTTTDTGDRARLQEIVDSLGVKDVDAAREKLGQAIAKAQHLIVNQTALLIGLGISLFALFAFAKTQAPVQFAIVVLSLLSLLASGVATPMIDMEAKISQLKFVLVGHPLVFENQILYFQSKGILDVFWLMVTDSQIQMKLVGILVVSFSLIFPLLKLLSTVAYYFNFKDAQKRTLTKFFVEKSGKWSMADVMVVAIFMAYIGFNGVINSQLKELNFPDSGVEVIATNGTSLQPGYFLFIAYVIIAILLSGLLMRRSVKAPG